MPITAIGFRERPGSEDRDVVRQVVAFAMAEMPRMRVAVLRFFARWPG